MRRTIRTGLSSMALVSGLWIVSSSALAGEPGGAAVPAPTAAQTAALEHAAIAAAQAKAASEGVVPAVSTSPEVTVHPDIQEPLNTDLGPFYAVNNECEMYAMFGNFYGVAYGKSEVWDRTAECGVADYIVAYSNGNYADGAIVSAQGNAGWTNPQSTVAGYSVLIEYVWVCDQNSNCSNYEFDAL